MRPRVLAKARLAKTISEKSSRKRGAFASTRGRVRSPEPEQLCQQQMKDVVRLLQIARLRYRRSARHRSDRAEKSSGFSLG